LQAARSWGNLALERQEWTEAVEAFDYGLEAANQLNHTQVLRHSNAVWLHEAQGLSTCAAYALARIGDLARAVMVVENGRTRLLFEALESERAGLERLGELGHSDLFDRYKRAEAHLQELVQADKYAAGDAVFSALRTAHEELNAAIAAIRQVPGYGDFFVTPAFEEIQQVAISDTPLVYLITTPVGSLALFVLGVPELGHVKAFSEIVTPVWLNFTSEELRHLLHGYLAGLLDKKNLQDSLDKVLSVLGEKLMTSVVTHLRGVDAKGAVLIPGGLVGLLPLHAALVEINGQRSSVLDEFTISYAPSAYLLSVSRRRSQEWSRQSPSLLAVLDPTSDLPFARTEGEAIAKLFDTKAVLVGTMATSEAVLAKAEGFRYLHFACHGFYNWINATESALILADGAAFTLETISRLDLHSARLVTLAASQTALTDFQNVPDEYIGLATGFLQVGAAAVVSTLWDVSDLSTMLLMEQFYKNHLRGMGLPEALQKAQLWLRELTAQEVAEYMEAEQLEMSSNPMATIRHRFILMAPDSRPFAPPFYWAGFVLTGI
jgi:CHAT domain-containing protein